MSDHIFFDGKRYISAHDAAEHSDVTRDYISRLCRDGKVRGKRVGKNWYVEEESLKHFLIEQEYQKSLRKESLAKQREEEYRKTNPGYIRPVSVKTTALVAAVPVKSSPIIHAAGKATAYSPIYAKLASAVAQQSGKALEKANDFVTTPSGFADAAIRVAHVPTYAVTPVGEFVHKLVALTLAVTLTFGTYALVDPHAGNFVLDSVRSTGAALADVYDDARNGGVASFASSIRVQAAAAASNPSLVLGSVPDFFSSLARSVNARVNSLVYSIAFPQALLASFGARDAGGTVAINIEPYARSSSANALGTQQNDLSSGSASVGASALQPIVQKVTVERIVEAGGISEDYLNDRLAQLSNKLVAQIYGLTSAPSSLPATGGYTNNIALSQRIDQLHGTDISDATITGGTISGARISGSSISADDLTVSGLSSLATTTVTGDLTVNGSVAMQNISLSSTTVTINGTDGQTSNFLDIKDSNGDTVFAVQPDGSIISNTSSTTLSYSQLLVTGNATATNMVILDTASTTNLIAGNATTTNFFAENASTTNATSTNLFAATAHFLSSVFDSLSATFASITNLAATELVATNATTTNATTTNLAVTNLTSFTAPIAPYFTATSSTASQFPYASSTALTVSGASFFNGGFLSLASSTIGNGTQAGGLTISGGATTTGNAYFGGRIGIGTTNPTYKLDIQQASNTYGVRTTDGTTEVVLGINSSGAGTIGTRSSSNLILRTGNSDRVTVNTSGNLGIGTTNPQAKLDVNGTANLAYPSNWGTVGGRAKVSFGNEDLYQMGVGFVSGLSSFVGIASNNALYLMSDSAESSRGIAFLGADNTVNFAQNAGNGNTYIRGNVGVGSSTPSQKLSVAGDTYLGGNVTATGTLAVTGTSAFTGSASFTNGLFSLASTTIGDGTQTGGLTILGSATTTGKAYFADSVGIGTTNITDKFVVSGGNILIDNQRGLYSANAAGNSSAALIIADGSNNVLVGQAVTWGRVDIKGLSALHNGNVGIGSTTPATALGVAGSGYFTGGLGVGVLNTLGGTLRTSGDANIGGALTLGTPLDQGQGGVGFTSYTAGDILYADGSGNLAKLPIGSSGSVLKMQAGLPAWGTDLNDGGGGGGGGGESQWATSTDSLLLFPNDTSRTVLIGTNATSTQNSIFEVSGQAYISSKLGIGTTSPYAALSVNGTAAIGNFYMDNTTACGNTFHAFIGPRGSVGGDECAALNVTQKDTNGNIIYRFGEANGSWAGEFYANSGRVALNTKSAVPIGFEIQGSEKARIDASGNFGVGTTTPVGKFNIAVADSADALTIINAGNSNKAWTLFPSGNDLRLFEYSGAAGGSGNARVTFRAGGNVGIGPTVPTEKLHIEGSSANLLIANTSETDAGIKFTDADDGANQNASVIYGAGDNLLKLYNKTSLGVAIDTSGNVGLGTTSPFAKLSVAGSAYVGGNLTATGTLAAIGAATLSSTLDVTGKTTLTSASTSLLSVTGTAYFGGSATSTFNSAGQLALVSNGLTVGGSQLVVSGGNLGIGTTTPWGKLAINLNNGDTNANAFIIASSTASATTTLFSVDNAGNTNVNGILEFGGIGLSGTSYFTLSALGLQSTDTHGARLSRLTGVGGPALQPDKNYFSGIGADGSGGVSIFAGSGNFSNPEVARFDANGNAGIGTTTPWGKLSVLAADNASAPQFVVGSSTATSLMVASNGNVGIGTSSPLTKFSIQGTAGANDLLNVASSTGASLLYVNAGGNVGIGTTLPQASLDVVNETDQDVFSLTRYITSSPTVGAGVGINFRRARGSISSPASVAANDTLGVIRMWGYDGSAFDQVANIQTVAQTVSGGNISGKINFILADTAGSLQTRMVLDESGNVGIGTTSPATMLAAAGDAYFTGGLGLGTVNTSAGSIVATAGGTFGGALLVNSGGIAVTGNSTIAGTLGSLTGLSSSGTVTFSGLTATRAVCTTTGGQLTVSCTSAGLAASLSNETGTGSVVFGTSPSLTTPTIAGATLSGNINLPSGIWNSTGSVGIGDTTPDHTLDVAGNIGLDASGYINFGDIDGSGGYGFRDNAGTIEYKNSAGTWTGVGSGGGSAFAWTPTTNFGAAANATSTAIWFQAGLQASSTSQFAAANVYGNLGVGTTSPFRKLSVTDTVAAAQVAIAYDASRYAQLQTDSAGDFHVNASGGDTQLDDSNFWVCAGGSCPAGTPSGTGNLIVETKLGVGTSTPAQSLSTAGLLYVGASGASGMGTATSTFQGDIRITGKLDVSTIDPVYTIDGIKYATYGDSTVGIHENMQTTFALEKDADGRYSHVIDFSTAEKGSDTWLFYQITDFGSDWQQLVVQLTAGFDGSVSYKKVPEKRQLIVYGTGEGEVSMHLSANRYDFSKWPNLRTDQDGDTSGTHVISSKPVQQD